MSARCKNCNDTGLVDLPGELIPIVNIPRRRECECVAAQKLEADDAMRTKIYRNSGIPPRFAAARLTDIPASIGSRITNWITDEQSLGWIYLHGLPGTGKSHLAAAIGRAACDQFWKTYWVSASDAACQIAEFGGSKELDRLRAFGILIVDDLGLRAPTPGQSEALYRLLDYRYSHQKKTVITSNCTIADIGKIPGFDRIASRIEEEARALTFNPTVNWRARHVNT